MKKIAIIVDGQFLINRLKSCLRNGNPSSNIVLKYLHSLPLSEEETYRIFFYQGEPSRQSTTRPFSGETADFKESPIAKYNTQLLKELSLQDFLAVRKGDTQFRGWKLKSDVQSQIFKGELQEDLSDKHFAPEFQQKGVDIRIGLDVAWLANKKLVDRIIMVTGDADFTPAMKFARKEGIQVVLQKLTNKNINDSLAEHSDFVRTHSTSDIQTICSS